MRRTTTAAIAGALVLVLAACDGGADTEEPPPQPESIRVLIGTSDDAETETLQTAADAWTEESGVEVSVLATRDLAQEIAQGYAGDIPPDLFTMRWEQFPSYAADDYLDAYASDVDTEAFSPSLVEQYSQGGELVCVPKAESTLGLVIDAAQWEAAGLTDDDIPTTWDELAAVAETLTTDESVGLTMDAAYDRVGAFMAQAGGGLMTDDEVTADSDANVAALEYLQGMLEAGSLQWTGDLEADSAVDALADGTAAMAVEGAWAVDAIEAHDDLETRIVELPAGEQAGSLAFSSCWGIPAGSDTADAAEDLVTFLSSDEQQLALAEASGLLPPSPSVAAAYAEAHPEMAAFVAAAEHATAPVAFPGSAAVVSHLDGELSSLAEADASELLADVQERLDAAWAEAR